MPGGIVQLLVIIAQILVIDQAFDRRAPEERAETHLRGALGDHGADVGRNFRSHREAGVLETIRARRQAAPDFLRPMRMRHDR